MADGSTTLARYNWTNASSGSNTNQGINIIYKATSTTLNLESVSASAISRIEGDGTTDQTWFTLEEIPFGTETTWKVLNLEAAMLYMEPIKAAEPI